MAGSDRGELPFLESMPAAARAFASTSSARRAYQNTLPSADFLPPDEAEARYYHEVQPRLVSGAPPLPFPSQKELSVRLSATEALAIFRREIWPIVEELADAEAQRVGRALDRDDELRSRAAAVRKNSAAAADLAGKILRAIRTSGEAGSRASAGAVKLARKIMGSLWSVSARQIGVGRFTGMSVAFRDPRGASTARKSSDRLSRARSAFAIETSWFESEQSEFSPPAVPVPNLELTLNRLLPPRTPGWQSGFASGSRLDTQRALHATATGHGFETIWQRRARPKAFRLAVMLLVDCSGSMRGERIDAATAATRLLAESLHRIRACDLSVYGFQDVLIPVIRHGEALSDETRLRIASLKREVSGDNPAPWGNDRPSYNDDGPVLREAATILAARPVSARLLIVVSDGGPSGRRSSPEDLHTAVAEVSKMPGMTVVGLGLGEAGTEAVAEYYPRSEVNVELAKLGDTVGRLLCRAFRAAKRGR